MKSTRSLMCMILVACTLFFTASVQVPAAMSSADSPFKPNDNAFLNNTTQSVVVIPEEGYFVSNPGVDKPVRGSLSDPVGRKIQEILEMDTAEGTPQNSAQPMSEILVTNSADSGMGSLRWAIEQANNNPGPDVIHFYLSGMTISISSMLPAITDDGTIIDASPKWIGSWPVGKPGIKLDGSLIVDYSTGLLIFGTNNVTVKGIEIQNFNQCIWIGDATNTTIGEGASSAGGGRMLIHNCNGPAIYINGGHDNRILGSYIGTSDAGNLAEPNSGDGITINNSQRNAIGGAGALEGNLIGASDYGVRILGSDSISNTVVANQIGVGMLNGDIGNLHDGVYIGEAAYFNAIGGSITAQPGHSVVYTCAEKGNEIRNNGGNGVTLAGPGNLRNGILNNYISENQSNGIVVSNSAQMSVIGCNTIVSNAESGIFVDQPGTSGHWILGNYIGIDALYPTAPANGKHGVGVYDGASNNLLDSNFIGNNGWSGVAIVGIDSQKNWLFKNHIGVGMNQESVGNLVYGVDIMSSPDNVLTANEIAHNGLSGSFAGVHIGEDTAVGNGLYRNSIYQNTGFGIELTNRAQNEIGAPVINHAQCPVISGIAGPIGARVEIFSDTADEGRYYEGSVTVDDQYQWSYSGFFRGPNLTATVTDMATHDTSMFSAPAIGVGSCNHIFLPIGFRNK